MSGGKVESTGTVFERTAVINREPRTIRSQRGISLTLNGDDSFAYGGAVDIRRGRARFVGAHFVETTVFSEFGTADGGAVSMRGVQGVEAVYMEG